MKETMFDVSRTVSPWAICDFPSSRSDTVRPSRLHAEAKLNRVRVELSRNSETRQPAVVHPGGDVARRAGPSGPGRTWRMASSSSRLLSHVRRKSRPAARPAPSAERPSIMRWMSCAVMCGHQNLPSAARIFSGVNGQSRTQTPTASWMAAARAGAAPFTLISATLLPPNGPKRSSVWTMRHAEIPGQLLDHGHAVVRQPRGEAAALLVEDHFLVQRMADGLQHRRRRPGPGPARD